MGIEVHLPERSSGLGLEWTNATKRFGGVAALKGVSIPMEMGIITAVIGPNGAGKTSLFNSATGLGRLDEGKVQFGGIDITRSSAAQIARLGLSRTFQNLRMIDGATVWETLLAARARYRHFAAPSSWLSSRRTKRSNSAEGDLLKQILGALGLEKLANVKTDKLSLLDQRRVELARALASQPKFVLLDEPTAGTTPAEAEEMGEFIRSLPTRGISVGLIEHSVGFISSVADVAYVLNFGELVAFGSAASISQNALVQEVFVGVGFEGAPSSDQ